MDNDYNYSAPKKKSKAGGIACLILSVSVLIGTVFGCFIIYNKSDVDYSDKVAELDEKYQSQIETLQSKIDALESGSGTSNSLSNLSTGSSTPQTVVDLTGSATISEIASAVKPSIVTIIVTVPESRVQYGFFYYSTGGTESSGTGIILSEDGYIATNYHVVSYYDEYDDVTIAVTLSDGTEYAAEFIGGDSTNDIAVIKIKPEGKVLPTAKFGQSSSLQVGEVVLAIGNPLGIEFAGSVTMGIVSALDRTVKEENSCETMIQTDAAINPGNSGGALVNASGEVIGITTLKVSDTDVEGLGFAIPIDYAKPIIDDLIEYGYVKDRPATGISGETISASVARYYRVPQGLLVSDVVENSGADLAGIEVNDIITQIEGKEVTSMTDLQDINKAHKVGDIIEVTFYRNGEYYTTNMLLMEDRGR